jgi:hypothetical protein
MQPNVTGVSREDRQKVLDEIREFERRGTPAGRFEVFTAIRLGEEIAEREALRNLLRIGELVVSEIDADGNEPKFASARDSETCSQTSCRTTKH